MPFDFEYRSDSTLGILGPQGIFKNEDLCALDLLNSQKKVQAKMTRFAAIYIYKAIKIQTYYQPSCM